MAAFNYSRIFPARRQERLRIFSGRARRLLRIDQSGAQAGRPDPGPYRTRVGQSFPRLTHGALSIQQESTLRHLSRFTHGLLS